MTAPNHANRCRIVLVAPPVGDSDALAALLRKALSGGDAASVILDSAGLDEATFQAAAQKAIPVIQSAGAAALILNDTQIAGRVGADGVHIEGKIADLADTIERHAPRLIVGMGNLRDRHGALEIGELQPDYVMFGKVGADMKPEPHSRNIGLAEWWAPMVEIPCIVQAGNILASIEQAAATGAEFVALGAAIFASDDPAEAMREANRLLDETAPRFES
ncbi:thiamine phosphate synthase [Phyllobacterium leguminum]|uniref:Thiamine-phosphate diphosphorylase n=1 Tax=Phyllobacterium leguminum TaxID=314237 RepID=A0A318T631_9HYPH|nr:thiamine phosphate synthase [Phyllobacterium leguminum]PYE88684.1 thiamine-phosphate diphosphorylase [Phyllobacterium leguminum]